MTVLAARDGAALSAQTFIIAGRTVYITTIFTSSSKPNNVQVRISNVRNAVPAGQTSCFIGLIDD